MAKWKGKRLCCVMLLTFHYFRQAMPPDIYSIHLIQPDTTYEFHSYKSFLYFLDTTHLITKENKEQYIRNFKFVQQEINRVSGTDKTDNESAFLIVCGVLIVLGLILSYLINRPFAKPKKQAGIAPHQEHTEQHFTYKGNDLDFDSVTLEIICLKYNAFFRTLERSGQVLFLEKLEEFMRRKKFYMYGEDCYREMPVLLSATATQLGFGFPAFHLNNYPNIVIHPHAYIAYEPLRVLAGNVQGNTITISWEHFLKDNLDPDDGNNVGLHEMAHAFAMQMLYTPSKMYKQSAELLRDFYVKLAEFIYLEKQQTSSLFDAYSLQSADECWAKCIELFFEKPDEMKYYYPELYTSVRQILNQ